MSGPALAGLAVGLITIFVLLEISRRRYFMRVLDMRFNTGRARGLFDAVELSTRMAECCSNPEYLDVAVAVNHLLQGCSIVNPVPKDMTETILPKAGLPEWLSKRPAVSIVLPGVSGTPPKPDRTLS